MTTTCVTVTNESTQYLFTIKAIQKLFLGRSGVRAVTFFMARGVQCRQERWECRQRRDRQAGYTSATERLPIINLCTPVAPNILPTHHRLDWKNVAKTKRQFLLRCMERSRGLAMRILSLCLSVRPCVKRVNCDETGKKICPDFYTIQKII